MKKEIVYTQNAPQPIGPYSQAIKMGNFVFLSGQIALDSKTGVLITGFAAQCRQVLENIKNVLQASGLSLNHVVKTTVFLTDLGKFSEFNAIYNEYFGESKPARSTVEVRALPKNAEVEIEVIASAE